MIPTQEKRAFRSWGAYGLCSAIVLLVGCFLVTLNRSSDYLRRHEDNNALYATFARAHVRLGLEVTKAHDMFVSRTSGATSFYGHHPPGVALALALAFELSDDDSPAVVRTVAIVFHVAGLLAFFLLSQRFLGPRAAIAAAALYAILPMGAFYGRMANHEPFTLPFMIVVVGSYFTYLDSKNRSYLLLLAGAALAGAVMGWVMFFALGACVLHAFFLWHRGQGHARVALFMIIGVGMVASGLVFLHLYWVVQGNLDDLSRIFFARVGIGKDYGPFAWSGDALQKAAKLFSISGVVATGWVLWKVLRAIPRERNEVPVAFQLSAVFLLTGLFYMAVFNWGAWQHQYWQMPLLPGVALSLTLGFRQIVGWRKASGSRLALALAILIPIEVVASSASTLTKLQTRQDPFAVKRVYELRRDHI